ncbi:flippase [Chloroflexota bacterium]
MGQSKKFAFDVSVVLVSSVVNLLIVFVLRMVLARWLGPSDLGLYTMVITLQEITLLFAELGISSALVKYVAEYKDDRNKLLKLVSSAFITSLIFGLITGILLYFISGTFATLFKMPDLSYLLKVLSIALPFMALQMAAGGLLSGLRHMKRFAMMTISRSVLTILLTISFIWLGFGVRGATFGIVLATVLSCLYGLYFVKNYFYPTLQEYLINVKKLVLFGSQAFGANVVSLIANRTDFLMIGYFLTTKDVGYYNIAVSLSMLFDVVPRAIQRISFPAASEYWKNNDHQSLQKMIDKSMKYSACILLPAGLGFAFFSSQITTLIFGQEFLVAVSPFLFLLAVRVIRGATVQPIGSVYSGRGRPDIGLKIGTSTSVFNIGLNIILIPYLGIIGAAIATTTSLLAGAIIFLALLPKLLGTRIDIVWYVRALSSTVLSAFIFWTGTRFITPYVLGGLILAGYCFLDIKFFLTKEDRALIRSIVYSIVRKK